MSITNATRLSDFAAGIGTEGAILKIDNANQRVGIGTQLPNQMLTVAGIVSATQYIGDGSQLEGITSAGLGTAIDETEGSAGAVVYYTDDLLTVAETTTINPPASASAAYTQYRDVKLNDNVDLIIETGDDFIPDILGFGDDTSDPNAAGNGVFDEVYSDIIKNKNGLGAPTFTNGFTSVGVGTFSSDVIIDGNVSVGGTLTYEDVKNVDSVGLITARTGIKVTAGGIDVTAGAIVAGAGVNVTSGNVHVGQGGAGSNNGELKIQAGAATGNDVVAFLNQAGSTRGNITYDTDHNFLMLNVNQGEKLRIGSAGQIGLSGANYGTSGQVLSSQGASAAPQWADAAGAGLEWVAGQTDPNSNYITFTGLTETNVSAYKVIWSGISMNGNGSDRLQAQFQTSVGGGTWITASEYANKVWLCEWNGNTRTVWWDANKDCIQFVGNESGEVHSGEMYIPINANKVNSGQGDKYAYGRAFNSWGEGTFKIRMTTANFRLYAITGIRFKNNNGNLTGVKGRIDIYKYTQS